MNPVIRLPLVAALLFSGLQAQAQDKSYIVRFKESAVPAVKAGAVRDERLAREPERWSHVGERTLSHVQTLEKRHKVRADAAYGTVFKGMSARLTPAQREALLRDPSVDRIRGVGLGPGLQAHPASDRDPAAARWSDCGSGYGARSLRLQGVGSLSGPVPVRTRCRDPGPRFRVGRLADPICPGRCLPFPSEVRVPRCASGGPGGRRGSGLCTEAQD